MTNVGKLIAKVKSFILENIVVRWARYIATRKVHRETIKTLNRLTDRDLKDIGINRGDISNLIFRVEDRKNMGGK